jgi:hypothetical protein
MKLGSSPNFHPCFWEQLSLSEKGLYFSSERVFLAIHSNELETVDKLQLKLV